MNLLVSDRGITTPMQRTYRVSRFVAVASVAADWERYAAHPSVEAQPECHFLAFEVRWHLEPAVLSGDIGSNNLQ